MTLPSLPARLDGRTLALETRAVHVTYAGGTAALAGLDLQVPEGAVYVLAGPNGAGKSTAIKVLLDLVRPRQGTAHVCGVEVARKPALARAHVGYVPEKAEISLGWLDAARYLRHHAAFFDAWDWDYARALCARLNVPLEPRVGTLSKGGLRALMLVTALAHRPPVLLLDEPADGLDPLARETLAALLVEHMAEWPTTVLWSTHHVHEADRLADHVGLLLGGRLVLQAERGALDAALRRYRIQAPPGWAGAPSLNGEVLLREGSGPDLAWTVWGDEREVAGRITASGATVRDAARLSLEDAALAVLRAGSRP
ncbi:MAG TPA: ABC transporter ATP-binding protein [Longimicrobium sp.]|nr:ABC transporter ATP-binding protein [Longimicrobium sp.]